MPYSDDELKTLRETIAAVIYETLPTSVFAGKEADVGDTKEREFEVGKDEAWFANIKRTYDEYQTVALDAARRSQSDHDRTSNVALQALQNAVETANMVAKQAIRQSDVACDAQWSPVEAGAGNALTARAVTIDDASLKAIGATVAAALAQALANKA
jgi:hypothetical protein